MPALLNNARIGDGAYDALKLGGIVLNPGTFSKANYPGLRAIRIGNTITLASALADSVAVNPLPSGSSGAALGYAEITADQTGLGAGPTDITGLAVTVDLPAARRIRVSAHVTGLQSTVATDRALGLIREGSTQLQQHVHRFTITGSIDGGMYWAWIGTPSAGSHTYKVSHNRVGTGTHTWSAAATAPSFVLVEDIGPSSPQAAVELYY